MFRMLCLFIMSTALLCSLGCSSEPTLVHKDLGSLKTSPSIKGRDGGFSALFQGVSVWVYGDTVLTKPGADGSSWRHNTWSWTPELSYTSGLGGFQEATDQADAPVELFPLTEKEAQFNEDHKGEDCKVKPCQARWAIWPGPVIPDPARQRALVSYVKIYGEVGDFNFRGVGHSFAIWKDVKKPVERPVISPQLEHPTLLFGEKEPGFGISGALLKDETLYGFSCQGGLSKPCRLGRVAVADALKPSFWEVWDGAAWQRDKSKAAGLFDGAPMMSVHWNEYLKRYIAVYSKPLSKDVVLRTAQELQGPWSDEIFAFQAEASHDDAAPYGALAHVEMARETGRYELITYFRSPATWAGEIRMVELDVSSLKGD